MNHAYDIAIQTGDDASTLEVVGHADTRKEALEELSQYLDAHCLNHATVSLQDTGTTVAVDGYNHAPLYRIIATI